MRIRCTYCGAELEINPEDKVVTCQYCGTTFMVGGGEIERHLMGTVNYSVQEIFKIFKEWALRKPETPNDFELSSSLRSWRLMFLPYWLFKVRVKSNYRGYVREVTRGLWRRFRTTAVTGYEEEVYDIAVPASAKSLKHEFGLRGKVFFNEREVRDNNGILVHASVDMGYAKNRAKSMAVERLIGKLGRRGVFNVNIVGSTVDILDESFVHIPIYEIEYRYRGGTYKFYADASDSRIILAEIPSGLVFRTGLITLALTSFAAGVGAFILGLTLSMPIFAVTSAIYFGTIGVLLGRKAAERKVVLHRYGSREEGEIPRKLLDIIGVKAV